MSLTQPNRIDTRKLSDLTSVGKAMLVDFKTLRIESVAQLADADPVELYDRLGVISGGPHDICVLDTLRAAVAQARDPGLPAEQRKWWYWSRLRKSGAEVQAVTGGTSKNTEDPHERRRA